ncbi:MAG: hypothetical protein AAFP77_30280 [Bacteroidota bacterium]
MNIRTVACCALILVFFSCGNPPADFELEGHWHLYEAGSDNRYVILDIRKDTIVSFDGLNYLAEGNEIGFLKNGKNINVDSQFILLYDGMYGLYDYELRGDTLLLEEREDVTFMDRRFKGVRKKVEDCDVLADAFSREQVEVALPLKAKHETAISLSKGFIFDIVIGRHKTTGLTSIEVQNRLVEKEDLWLAFEKFKVKVPRAKHDQLILRLSIDKTESLDLLGEYYDVIDTFPFKQRVEQKIDNNKVILVSAS